MVFLVVDSSTGDLAHSRSPTRGHFRPSRHSTQLLKHARVAAGLGPPGEHALVSLLALNGLRVSEATGADIEQLGLEFGHRTLTMTR
jgi:hypothetical protein